MRKRYKLISGKVSEIEKINLEVNEFIEQKTIDGLYDQFDITTIPLTNGYIYICTD